jgi:hypothetical protein
LLCKFNGVTVFKIPVAGMETAAVSFYLICPPIPTAKLAVLRLVKIPV